MNRLKVDLNCDLGEQFGKPNTSIDHLLMPYISSCNIACGFHSGDPMSIQRAIKSAIQHNVAIGAHPSFPDLQGFGRREMHISPKELSAIVIYQISALKGMVEAEGGKMHHVKAHGALYNMASKLTDYASAICEAVARIDRSLIVYGLSDSLMAVEAEKQGLQFYHEVFVDRLYEQDKSLRSRKFADAVLNKEAMLEQLDFFISKQSVQTIDGDFVSISMDTICLHSDSPDAVKTIESIYKKLRNQQIEITAYK